MQFSIFINQARSVEWGLNSQQALLFAYLYSVPSWAEQVLVEGQRYYRLDRDKVIRDLPILTDKLDTVYRLMKQLVDCGLLNVVRTGNRTAIRLTEKAAMWNHAQIVPSSQPVDNHEQNHPDKMQHPEKNPSSPGKKSEIHPEKNPSNSSLYINNPIIKHNTQSTSQDSLRDAQGGDVDNPDLFAGTGQAELPPEKPADKKSAKAGYPQWFETLWSQFPPRSGASDKRRALQAANARVGEGKTPDDFLAAVDRYAKFVRATGRWGSQYVMQAQTFFGPGGHVDNPWSVPHDFSRTNPVPRESLIERIERQAREVCADAEASAHCGGVVDADDADFRPAMGGAAGRR